MALVCANLSSDNIADFTDPITAHLATACRLYEAEYGEFPTIEKLARLNLTGLMNGMLAQGERQSKPFCRDLVLLPGSVLLFEFEGEAVHSSVVKRCDVLVGYDQTTVFRSRGVVHGYSAHNTSELLWDRVGRTVSTGITHSASGEPVTRDRYAQLFLVREADARVFFRAALAANDEHDG